MRLFLNNNYYEDISIEIGNLNQIISGNGMGKTMFLNTLRNSFEGKEKDFALDGKSISKDDYFIYYIGENDSLYLEKNLSTKSLLRNEIKSILIDKSEIVKDYSNKLSKLSDDINNDLLKLELSDNIELNIKLDLNELIIKYSDIYVNNTSLDQMSYTSKRMSYINLIINRIIDLSRPCVLLIDEPFSNLDDYNTNEIIHLLKETATNNDVLIFITSSKKSIPGFNPIYTNKNEISNSILKDNDYYEMISLYNKCSYDEAYEYTTEEELAKIKCDFNEKYDLEYLFINNMHRYSTISEFASVIKKKYIV